MGTRHWVRGPKCKHPAPPSKKSLTVSRKHKSEEAECANRQISPIFSGTNAEPLVT